MRKNVWLVKGFFKDSLPKWLEENNSRVAFLHISSDIYPSSKTILGLLDSRFMPGTVIVFGKLSDWRDEMNNEIRPQSEWRAMVQWLAESGRRVRILSHAEGHAAAIQIA